MNGVGSGDFGGCGAAAISDDARVGLPTDDLALVPTSTEPARFGGRKEKREGRTTMAPVVVGTFLTLDGVMQGPGGPDEDRTGGFAHGGWSVGYWDDAMGKIITEWTARADALLLGRTTYEIFAAHWPHVPDDDPVGAVLNRVPKYVASTTLKTVQWNNSKLLHRDVPGSASSGSGPRGFCRVPWPQPPSTPAASVPAVPASPSRSSCRRPRRRALGEPAGGCAGVIGDMASVDPASAEPADHGGVAVVEEEAGAGVQ